MQVNSVQDVGTSSYSQMQVLRKDDTQNASVDADKPMQVSSHLCLSPMIVHGFFAVGHFAVGQFVVRKYVGFG